MLVFVLFLRYTFKNFKAELETNYPKLFKEHRRQNYQNFHSLRFQKLKDILPLPFTKSTRLQISKMLLKKIQTFSKYYYEIVFFK